MKQERIKDCLLSAVLVLNELTDAFWVVVDVFI